MKLARRSFLHSAAGAAAFASLSRNACAESYPTRPVRFVVPLPAGSSPDITARVSAEQLAHTWAQAVVVENRPGGGGIIATQGVLSAIPDGHTLLFAVASIFTVLPAQREKPRFDVNRDLIPIALTANNGMVIATSSKLGVNTLGELITMAKREPNKVIIGTNPAGSLPHLAAMLIVRQSQAPFVVVPAAGGTNLAITEIMGGRVHAVIDTLPALKGALDAGSLKGLAIMAPDRSTAAPDIPTAAETVPGLLALGWSAVVAPRETPSVVQQQLTDGLRKVMESSDTRARLERVGVPPFKPIFAADLARFVEAEEKLWWPIVEAELR